MDEKTTHIVNEAKNAGIVIKHVNNTDVCFFALGVLHADDDLICIRGYWINIAAVTPYNIDSDVISIKCSDIVNWNEIPDPRHA